MTAVSRHLQPTSHFVQTASSEDFTVNFKFLHISIAMQTISAPGSISRRSQTLRSRLVSKFTRKHHAAKVDEKALESKTLDQSHSILFTLPAEIRELVWKAVLGDRIIHIQHLDGRLGHVRCADKDCGKWEMGNHKCWGYGHINIGAVQCPNSYAPLIARSHICGIHLGLVMTCRLMFVPLCFLRPGHCELMSYRYDEAINLLYTSNTISIRHLHIISQFRTVLPPQRLNLVTSLHLSWTIDWRAAWVVYPPVHGSTSSSRAEDQPTWLNAWKILARFKGLKVLRIELRECYRSYYPSGVENRAMLLNDMCCIKQVRIFEVWIPWRLEDLGFVIDESPFTLLGQGGVIWEQTRR